MPAFTPSDMRAMEFATQIKNVLSNATNMVVTDSNKEVQTISASYNVKTQEVSYTVTYTDGTTSDTK